MDTATVIAMCAAICSAVSTLAALATCFFSAKQVVPRIKFHIQEDECLYAHALDKRFALISFDAENRSASAGTISDILIDYQKQRYHGENADSLYDISPLKLDIEDGVQHYKINPASRNFKLPIKVNGFSKVQGFILIPNFPIINSVSTVLTVRVRFVNHKFYHVRRRIVFHRQQGGQAISDKHPNQHT